jgi:hypothetical protein
MNQRFSLFFSKPVIKKKDSFETTKRKYNLQWYSNANFEKRFGLDIYKHLSKLSTLDKESEEFEKVTSLSKNDKTYGRRVKEMKKMIKC